MALYDLTRQWILHDGSFDLDYRWMMENYDPDAVRSWANDGFMQTYGLKLDDFEIV